MGKYAKAEWYLRHVAEHTAKFGAVPPPWVVVPTSHPYSIRWRMGSGETLLMVFQEWWEQQNWPEAERVEYFRRWPPPPRWIPWMTRHLWDLAWEVPGAFSHDRYYERVKKLGFAGVEEIDRDLADEQWLRAES
jgi:hypothetical protein